MDNVTPNAIAGRVSAPAKSAEAQQADRLWRSIRKRAAAGDRFRDTRKRPYRRSPEAANRARQISEDRTQHWPTKAGRRGSSGKSGRR